MPSLRRVNVCFANGIFQLPSFHNEPKNPAFLAKQYPRKFADQRDSGYFIGFWDEGPPKNQLYYTNEVSFKQFCRSV